MSDTAVTKELDAIISRMKEVPLYEMCWCDPPGHERNCDKAGKVVSYGWEFGAPEDERDAAELIRTGQLVPRDAVEGDWQSIETAPHGVDVLVWFDHNADPYQDPVEPGKLTPYAAWAEGGDFLDGQGWAIAKWFPRDFETEDEYGNGYWLPAAWFAHENGDYERVCNPLFWKPLTEPAAIASIKEAGDAD